jgi:hypothetical protein
MMLKNRERDMSAEETIIAYFMALFPTSVGGTGQNNQRKRKEARREIERNANEGNKQITFTESAKSAGKRTPFFWPRGLNTQKVSSHSLCPRVNSLQAVLAAMGR